MEFPRKAPPAKKLARKAIALEFDCLEPLLLWVPILSYLILALRAGTCVRTRELQQAHDILKTVMLSAAYDRAANSGSTVVALTPPGDWDTELAGTTGVVAVLRDAIARNEEVLNASDLATIRRWLTAAREAVLGRLADAVAASKHAAPRRESFVDRIFRMFAPSSVSSGESCGSLCSSAFQALRTFVILLYCTTGTCRLGVASPLALIP